jgi:rhomboid protease GluP
MIEEKPDSLPERKPDSTLHQVRVQMPSLPILVTYGLIGVTVIIYILQMLSVAVFGYATPYQMDYLELFGARINVAIEAGDYWRFITPVFLHGSLAHIFFNMYALFSIGGLLERHLGYTRYIALYVCSYLFSAEGSYSVGASTAVFGLIGAELIFFYQNRQLFGSYARQAISNIVFIIGINLFIGLSPNIDNWGHIGGLLGGAMFAWFASPLWAVSGIAPDLKLTDQREMREIITGGSIVLLIFAGLATWGLFFR